MIKIKVFVELDEIEYTNLIQILNQKFYATNDFSELQKINQIYKALDYNSETWIIELKESEELHDKK